MALLAHGMRPSMKISADDRIASASDGTPDGRQFIRGHGWPSGSIGLPHHMQLGRPAATSSSAWSQNAAAWLRVT